MDDLLFYKGNIFSVIEGHTQQVRKSVENLDPNRLLSASEEDLVQSLVAEYTLQVPVLKEDEIHIAETGETKVDVSHDPRRYIRDPSQTFCIPGNKTVIAIPFEGDPGFFAVQPQTFSLSPPRGRVQEGEVRLTYVRTDHDGAAIKNEYTRAVCEINDALRHLRESADPFNRELEGVVRGLVTKRKERLLADLGMVAAIGLPIKKRHGAPTTYAVPVRRRTPEITRPKPSTEPFKPEPMLSMQEYEDILRIMNNMVRVMELSPQAFLEMGEEGLRSHFLVQLNAQYEGQATGETFNFQGKTDILIRADGKNVFIAECKFWRGEKGFLEAISQLLSYLSWRDTKAAVLVFNRNAGFSAVLAKIKETVPKHPNFKREFGALDETAFRYVFAQPNDPTRETILTVLAFDIPTSPAGVKAIGAGQTLPNSDPV